MHVRTKVKGLSLRQFEALDVILKTSYDFPEEVTRVCVEFEMTEMHMRHVEMPRGELDQALLLLEQIEHQTRRMTATLLVETPSGGGRNGDDPL